MAQSRLRNATTARILLVDADFSLRQSPSSPSALSGKKDAALSSQTPLEKMLMNAGPIRIDGSDKFFGMENV